MIVTFALTLVFVALVNLAVDPFELYGSTILPVRNVNGYANKLKLYDEFDRSANILIMGSSKVMTFDPALVDSITGEMTFNFWLPGSGAETYYAALSLAIEQNEVPIDTIILGLGIETIHPAFPIQPEAKFVTEISRHFIYNPEFQGTMYERMGLLFTIDQTLNSYYKISQNIRGTRNQAQVDGIDVRKLEFRADGYTGHTLAETEIAEGTYDFDAEITSRLRQPRYTDQGMAIAAWQGIGGVRVQYWEDFLSLCVEEDITIYAFMTPAHRRFWELMDTFDAIPVFDEVTDYFRESVTGAGGSFRDFRYVESFNGNEDQFYDEIHMRPANCDALVVELLKDYEPGATE